MNQRRDVDHLDDGPQHVMRRRHIPAGPPHQQQQRRPQQLAVKLADVPAQVADEILVTDQLFAEPGLALRQVRGNRRVRVRQPQRS